MNIFDKQEIKEVRMYIIYINILHHIQIYLCEWVGGCGVWREVGVGCVYVCVCVIYQITNCTFKLRLAIWMHLPDICWRSDYIIGFVTPAIGPNKS